MPKKKEPSFAQARARLDEILAEVENEDGDVDQLADRVREAAVLIRLCRDRLAAARAQVTQVVAELAAVEEGVEQDAAHPRAAANEPGSEDEGSRRPGGLPF